jgi:tetratricopeptide (TPR) repeat protein
MKKLHFLCAVSLFLSALLPGCGKPRGSYETVFEEGLREYDSKDYNSAVAMFKAAAEMDRERPEPSYYTGLCYVAMAGQFFREDNLHAALRYCDRAIVTFDAAIGAFPGYSRAIQAKADALKLKGLNSAALEIANWAAAYVGPQAKMLILKARQYAQSGDIDQAQLTFKQAVSVEPKNAAAHAELGLFFMRCGNEREAIRSLQKAYQLDPAAPGVVSALARLGAMPSMDAPPKK